MDVLTIEAGEWTIRLRNVAHQDLACLPKAPLLRLGGSEYEPTSAVVVTGSSTEREIWSQVVTAVGGPTGVHEHSAVAVGSSVIVAVGPFVVCLHVADGRVVWYTQCDEATCFGVYFLRERDTLIVHGELDITRLTLQGQVLWKASGGDIFTGPVILRADCVEALDFNGGVYSIDLETGQSKVIGRGKPFPH